MLTGTKRAPLWAAWVSLLALWVITAWNAQSGFSSSGPMNLHFSPILLVLFSVPVSALAPMAARALGTRTHLVAAGAVVAITCWWQFWLPATLIDIGYSQRYDIPSPYIWPGAPGTPVLTLSVALWLMGAAADWKGWRLAGCWVSGALCTAAAMQVFDWLGYVNVPWPVALGGVVVAVILWAARHRVPTEHKAARLWMLWLACMAGVLPYWYGVETVADWVPRAMNKWFVAWLYS